METPRMSQYHEAITAVNKDLSNEEVLDHPSVPMQVIENHSRELHHLLADLVSQLSFEETDNQIIARLQEFGLLYPDPAHYKFVMSLEEKHRIAKQPSNPQHFYDTFQADLSGIFTQAHAATLLAAQVLLWNQGAINHNSLKTAVTAYNAISPLTQGET